MDGTGGTGGVANCYGRVGDFRALVSNPQEFVFPASHGSGKVKYLVLALFLTIFVWETPLHSHIYNKKSSKEVRNVAEKEHYGIHPKINLSQWFYATKY